MEDIKLNKKKQIFTKLYLVCLLFIGIPLTIFLLKAIIFPFINIPTDYFSSLDTILFAILGVAILMLIVFFVTHKLISIHNWKRLTVILLPLMLAYISLFIYGRFAIVPRNQALSLVNEANTRFYNSEAAERKVLIGEYKQYVSNYEQASKINLKQDSFLNNYPILEAYIQENYNLGKLLLAYEEDLESGKIVASQDEYNKKQDDFINKFRDVLNRYSSYGRTQVWMSLIFLK